MKAGRGPRAAAVGTCGCKRPTCYSCYSAAPCPGYRRAALCSPVARGQEAVQHGEALLRRIDPDPHAGGRPPAWRRYDGAGAGEGPHDGGYNRVAALLACFLLGLTLVIVCRVPGTKGFVVLPRRWLVERTLGWLGRWRRLSKDYECLPEVSEAMVTLAVVRLMLHRLAPRTASVRLLHDFRNGPEGVRGGVVLLCRPGPPRYRVHARKLRAPPIE